jgi:cation:H+ antiporter
MVEPKPPVMLTDIAGFLACATVIFFAGRRLSHYGDLLAERTGMGKAWVGIILMASVTSLPELMVGISSAAIVQSADLAVGDILGSCAFNLGILAMMDAFVPGRKPLFGLTSRNHVMTAALGVVLVSLVGTAMTLPKDIVISSWIGLTSLVFIAVYLVSVRLIYLNERNHPADTAGSQVADGSPGGPSLTRIVGWYAFFAVVIIGAALALPHFADRLAEHTGLGRSFVGTFLLAASTSLPEIAVSLAAVRMGSIDMAVGNLLGSNLFNILILAIDDIVYTRGHILKDASPYHMLSVLGTILMSAVVIIGITFQVKGKRFLLAWDSAAVFLIYVVNLFLLYRLTA